jgi:mono/diheme cytochrome c family protein
MRIWVVLFSLWIGSVAAVAAAAAQRGPAEPAARIWDGAFTAAQAARGADAYAAACTNCHSTNLSGGSGPALAGPNFLEKWQGEALTRLFRTIRDTMPRNDPGRLSDQGAVDIVAFILQSNQYPSGATELRPVADALAAFSIVPKGAPVARAVPNFALVQVVGCLAEADQAWTLVRASEPAATKDVAPAAAELQEAAALGGAGTVRLVSATPFGPASYRGQKVLVKGLINRTPEGMLLNVTRMETVSPGCEG